MASSSGGALSASATIDLVHEIATLLDTGLDRRTCQILMALVDAGVNPSALAAAVLELRRQAEELGLATGPSDAPSARPPPGS
jgi:mitotic-spindle organizing protein 1